MDKPVIQDLIKNNELKQAIETLVAHAREAGLHDWERELIDLSRRYRENADLYRKNLITSEVWSVNETRIASALLEILDHLEEGTPGPTAKEKQALQDALPEAPRSPFRTFAGIALALAQVVALIGVYVFWELQGLTTPAFSLAALLVLVLPAAAGYLAFRRFSGKSGDKVTPLQAFFFLLTLTLYLLGVYFFLYQKAVGGLFGEAFWPMQLAIGIWCAGFGVAAGYWVRRFFVV